MNAGPSAQGLLVSAFHRFLYLLSKCRSIKGPFLRERGMAYPLNYLLRRRTMNLSVRLLLRVSYLWSERPTELPGAYQSYDLTTTMWVVYRVHRGTANGRTKPRQRAAPALPRTRSICSALQLRPELHGSLLLLYAFHQNATQGDISTITSNDLNVSTSGTAS